MQLAFIENPLMLGLIFMLVLSVITDLKVRKVPNNLVVFGLLTSLVLQCLAVQGAGWVNWLTGVVAAFACFIPLYAMRAMAAGDVKLMMAVGGFLGFPLIISAVVYSYLAGGLIALAYVLFKGRFKMLCQNLYTLLYALMIDQFTKTTSGVNLYTDYKAKPSVGRMPFALAIALGTMVALLKTS